MLPPSCLARLEDTVAKGTSVRASRRQEEAHRARMDLFPEVPTEAAPCPRFLVQSLCLDLLLVEAEEGEDLLGNDSFKIVFSPPGPNSHHHHN